MSAPAAAAPAGPAPSIELMTPLEIERDYRRSAGRVRRHLGDGSLHGHRPNDVPGGRWSAPRAVVESWLRGETPAEQQRACPLCPDPEPTPLRSAGRRRRRP